MSALKMLTVGLTLVFFSGCGLVPPKPDICAIYSPDKAECNPTDPNKEIYELNTNDMLGYQCFSPKDFGEVKKFLKEVLRRLDKLERISNGIKSNY